MTAPELKANPGSEPPSRCRRLRDMLLSPGLEFLMEAHDGLSAKIVEEAGFKGVWASGLSVSAALGVRDSNEASWTQILEVLEFMADATALPILVDGDTGWGNFNNMRRAVAKLCQRGIAGICIEDKLFPKTNSFIGEGQPLAGIDEFCGKIKAGKDSQSDPDFAVVARVEALIAGWGLDEALKRAEAYHAAGADAILIHSKRSDAGEVLEFTRQWAGRCPVVIVPTKYYDTPTDDFRAAGVSVAIWANHNLRAAITAMRDVSRRIFRDQNLAGVEAGIASVGDIFELAGNSELAAAEKRYLPSRRHAPSAVVIAASRGEALGALTEDKPKSMIDIQGQPLLKRLTGTLKAAGVRRVTVVRGYKKGVINLPAIDTVDNDLFATTGEAASLACAADRIEGDCVIAYGDILFRRHYLDMLLQAGDDFVVAIDALWRERAADEGDRERDFAACSRPFSGDYLADDQVFLKGMDSHIPAADIHGEWIGLARLSEAGSAIVRQQLGAMGIDGSLHQASLLDLFNRIIAAGHRVRVIYVPGQWLDVDDLADLTAAGRFL